MAENEGRDSLETFIGRRYVDQDGVWTDKAAA
jgi:hypothetical protein